MLPIHTFWLRDKTKDCISYSIFTDIRAIYSRATDKILINLIKTIYDEKTTFNKFNKTRSQEC